MNRHRTTARGIAFLTLIFGLFTAGAVAAPLKAVPRLIFPVVGGATYIDDFGDARPGGTHQGNDLMAARHTPAVAVEPGTVKFWTTSANAGCMLYLYGDSGTTYLYIHLNNDLTAKNDNRGGCVAGTSYAPGLKSGAHVAAGQLVGFVGDSGDANGISPHLHFEVHPNGGAAVSPYKYLKKAQPLLFYAKSGTKVALTLNGTVVTSTDGQLAVQVTQLKVTGTTQKLTLRKKLVLSVEPDAVVQMPLDLPGGFGGTVTHASVKPGFKVTVYTAPAPATLEAQRGDADALSAARIVLG
jgi:hypothetical protein